MLDEVGVFAPEVVILPLASFKGQAASAGALAQAHWTSLGATAQDVIFRLGKRPDRPGDGGTC